MSRTRGFTLLELIVVLIIAGVLSLFVLPRFSGPATFDTRGFADQVGAALRFAQKAAIAQRRTVCVTTTSNSLTLSQAAAPPPSTACAGMLAIPGAKGGALTAPAGVTLSVVTLHFTALGQAVPGTTVTVAGDSAYAIAIEGETGHVH